VYFKVECLEHIFVANDLHYSLDYDIEQKIKFDNNNLRTDDVVDHIS